VVVVAATEAKATATKVGDAPVDDAAIRSAWAAGDMDRAVSLTIAQLGPEIAGFLSGTLEQVAADDALSLFYERVWLSLPRFEWRCSLRTWAYLVARRASIDVLRVEGRRRRREQPLPDSVLAMAERVRTATSPLFKTPGRTALARLRDELPADDRTLLVLRVDRGMSFEELARVFLEGESFGEEELHREAARLRQRYHLVKRRLRERARAAGLLSDSSGAPDTPASPSEAAGRRRRAPK
jgi:RNA polymerase sigma-70 factor (ECF subfamily)